MFDCVIFYDKFLCLIYHRRKIKIFTSQSWQTFLSIFLFINIFVQAIHYWIKEKNSLLIYRTFYPPPPEGVGIESLTEDMIRYISNRWSTIEFVVMWVYITHGLRQFRSNTDRGFVNSIVWNPRSVSLLLWDIKVRPIVGFWRCVNR
jgi:hypothetical protein